MRVALLVLAAFALGFLAVRAARDHVPSKKPAVDEQPGVSGPATTSGKSSPAVRRRMQAGSRAGSTGRIAHSALTPWQQLLVAEPEAAGITEYRVRRAVREELQMAPHPPQHCLREADLIGEFRLRFEVSVRSTASLIYVDGWRFAEIVDGSPLAADVIECLEAAWPAVGSIEPLGTEVFLEYAGAISLDLAYRAGQLSDVEP